MTALAPYIVFAAIFIIEIMAWASRRSELRTFFAWVAIIGISANTYQIILLQPLVIFSLLFIVFSIYRCVNLCRIISGRIELQYLRVVARRSSVYLTLFQCLCIAFVPASDWISTNSIYLLSAIVVLQFVAAGVLFASTYRSLRKTSYLSNDMHGPDKDVPTVTVAIPARDETDDLRACLDSLITSSYPKLEIIVLDDCSTTKRTSEIIRSYANNGILFAHGEPPPQNWVPKNFAYQQLLDVANGELLLFCGVDTRFQPNTIRSMVEAFIAKDKQMISFTPINSLETIRSFKDCLIQPSRYAWEFTIPRRRLQRPPVLSTAWLIRSELLIANGGFKAVRHSSSPESYFARVAIKDHDGYSFIRGSQSIGLTSQKLFLEQRLTAIRTRYPQLHRRIELVALISLLEAVVLLVPFTLLLSSALKSEWLYSVIGTLTCTTLLLTFSIILKIMYGSIHVRTLILMPLIAAYDIVLLNYSMYSYEFGEVIWKGRNICMPVLQTYPKLPKIL